MSNDFNFTESGYVPGSPFDFEFAPAEDLSIRILVGTSNDFTAIWVFEGKMYVASASALSVVNLDAQTLIDFYTQAQAGGLNETLQSNDIVDININLGS